MNQSQTCLLGDKEIEITANTSVRLRLATEEELSTYEKANWKFPTLEFQTELWEAMCSVLNSIKYGFWTTISEPVDEIWSNFVDKTCSVQVEDEYNDDIPKKLHNAPYYTTAKLQYDSCTCKLNSNHTIDIKSKYSYYFKRYYSSIQSIPQKKEDIHSCTFSTSTWHTTNISYPNDFFKLLNLMYAYMEKSTDFTYTFWGYSKPRKLVESGLKFRDFFYNYKDEIQKFHYYISSLEKITESDKYKRFHEKKAHYFLIVDDISFFEDNCGFDLKEKAHELTQMIQYIKEKQAAILREEEERQAAILREEEERQAAILRKEKERQAAILRKEKERQAIIQWKKGNSNDPGEKEVQYAIKWFLAESQFNITPIEKDCESKYRFNCIVLSKPDFIDEPQEYDHILVSDAGVILIETKHWSGRVEIRSDGKWVRETINDKGVSIVSGEKSPIAQIKRHETLIKKILPDIPVYSMICFSNKSIILDGRDNCNDYPIVYVDQLGEVITGILSNSQTQISIEQTVQEIEKHKINIEKIENIPI